MIKRRYFLTTSPIFYHHIFVVERVDIYMFIYYILLYNVLIFKFTFIMKTCLLYIQSEHIHCSTKINTYAS